MKQKILYCYAMRFFVLTSAAIALLMLLQTRQVWRALTKFLAVIHTEHNQA